MVSGATTKRTPRVLRGEVWWVNLDSTIGTAVRKSRPALVVTADDVNAALPRVIVAPLTSAGEPLPCRPEVRFSGKNARILLDQILCVDKVRLVKRMGKIDEARWHPTLLEMLA